ncbi:alpha/beta fold hydrolase [Streptacidiphilus sp. P02-A3a]|uniref:alpha/beta fold hydrolase n=1 Tax=Streptacidiphilus sp. P02-A3a TaxID=2704468 RepID=UPI0015FDCDE5|nr:alpha/beta hydrolase [Streptacidiphilus sp. P02-A3a]QMU68210.1 alpha/beta hydrolase [Streptacidiphilus sp. P02-A3a]
MRLNTREWGSGERIAVLVHGIMSDSRTWRRVGPALADRGYRVIAVDLRGHGGSHPRDADPDPGSDGAETGRYAPHRYAEDLAETLPPGVELAVGHSLGGLALAGAVERLRPRRAVYLDPAWRFDPLGAGFDPALFAEFADRATPALVAAMNPRWEQADVDTEMETLAVWDRACAAALTPLAGRRLLPERAVAPSLVLTADPSRLVPAEEAALLRARGFEVRTVPEAGHTIHRDDFAGFMTALEGWI